MCPCAGGDSSRMSPTYSPTSPSPSSPFFERMKNHDPEEDQSLYQRKSVLAKVKERARKLVLRNSLSRKRQDDDNITPSWGVSLEDEEGEEEDAEYLGAPSKVHITIKFLSNILKNGRISNCDCNYDHIVHD